MGKSMATKNKGMAKELATLALATALAQGDPKAVEAALKSGADADAFWIDGQKRLRQLAGSRGTIKEAEAIRKLFAPEALRVLPSKKSDPALWTQAFVEFVAMRGYSFGGRTTPLSPGDYGTSLNSPKSVKAAVRLIQNNWHRGLLDATCFDVEKGKLSRWLLKFDATWREDRRIVGFQLGFEVDALGWELLEEYKQAQKTLTSSQWPPLTSRYAKSQKLWESEQVEYAYRNEYLYTVPKLIDFFRAGANPFSRFADSLVGKNGEYEGTPETNAFMKAFRKALGPQEGWHLRVGPILTKQGITDLLAKIEKGQIVDSISKAKTTKKSLKARTDIL
jgi:hypothetical protein